MAAAAARLLFRKAYPQIDLRLFTNNNRIDIAGEGLDYAIRFGDGLWHGTEATHLMGAPFAPFCAASIARRLSRPADLKREVLLRSYRQDEWERWFAAAGSAEPGAEGNGIRFIGDDRKRGCARLRRGAVAGGTVSRMRSVSGGWCARSRSKWRSAITGSRRCTPGQPSAAMLSFKNWLLETIGAREANQRKRLAPQRRHHQKRDQSRAPG